MAKRPTFLQFANDETPPPLSTAILAFVQFYSEGGKQDPLFISNYVTQNVLDAIKRVPGTTNVQIFGAKDYAMRIWLRPDRKSVV